MVGRYNCNRGNIVNYLNLYENGTFYHFFQEDSIKLENSGKWDVIEDNGYHVIEFENWNDYNEKGTGYEEHSRGLLFINGKYLDVSPDGNDFDSFVKEEKK
jgi:hypothetical protein